jgi:WD repeat-containing protein 24
LPNLQAVLRQVRYLVSSIGMEQVHTLTFSSHSHLPVRSLLFQCSVCAHGGHQACYRNYYTGRPMVELPRLIPPATETRGQSVARSSPMGREADDDDSSTTTSENPLEGYSPAPTQSSKLIGHPCAAGCGHFCWAVSGTQK